MTAEPHDLEKIAPTAEFTAAAWAHLGLEDAAQFVTPRGRRLLRAYRVAAEPLARRLGAGPTLLEYLEYRHRAIDLKLAELAPDRLVECAAGLSRRGTTLAKRGVEVLELDLPHMVREKSRRVTHAGWPRGLAIERCDLLTDTFERRAREFLGGAARPVIVAEGFMSYLPLAVREAFLARVGDVLAASGGWFVGDFRFAARAPRARAASAAFKLLNRAVTSGRGLREDYASFERVVSSLEAAGFSRIEPVPPERVVPERASLPHPGIVIAASPRQSRHLTR
jgi:O-methyltransferase involved in polyketide biosynthesis